MLSEEAIDLFVKETTRLLKQRQASHVPASDAAAHDLAQAEKTINNLMSAIKAGIITPSTKAELERAEAERTRAQALLESSGGVTEQFATELPRAAEHYKALVGNLRKTLQRDVTHARQCLKTLVGSVRLLPHVGGYLQAELRHSAEGLISLAKEKALNIVMVAGARFGSNINPPLLVPLTYEGQRLKASPLQAAIPDCPVPAGQPAEQAAQPIAA